MGRPVDTDGELSPAGAGTGPVVLTGDQEAASPPGVRITISTLGPGEAEALAAALAGALRPAGRTRSA
jgi:hypothetical protein